MYICIHIHVYIPELHAAALENNVSMRAAVKGYCENDGLVYAECGGLMYLSQTLHTGDDDDDVYLGRIKL
jgi:cobyrinic acid a,c-diamide synthase